jgi:hypothetical protein
MINKRLTTDDLDFSTVDFERLHKKICTKFGNKVVYGNRILCFMFKDIKHLMINHVKMIQMLMDLGIIHKITVDGKFKGYKAYAFKINES